MIGDTYYNMGQYENAKTFLLQSIEKNFISYQAHWFLSDTYYKIGDIDSALKEITIAHLLNVNNQGIQKGIRYYRTKLQRPWKEWTFDPQYNLSKDGDKVTIKASEEWLGYALVKALWAYEPGYVESMLGEPRGTRMVVWPEEQEAVVVLMAANNKFKNIEEVFEKGYFTEFITYEMLGKKYPDALVLMPREAFMRIVEYVNAFH
jgi:tetratricopeptide (TPR) repeat protein